jgi:hypothetical protein
MMQEICTMLPDISFPKTKCLPCARSKPLHAALAFIALMFCLASPLPAAEPVTVILEGIEGDVLKNVKGALVLPHGLVVEGKVDLLWLERFGLQAEETVRTAMEPFGYYRCASRRCHWPFTVRVRRRSHCRN